MGGPRSIAQCDFCCSGYVSTSFCSECDFDVCNTCQAKRERRNAKKGCSIVISAHGDHLFKTTKCVRVPIAAFSSSCSSSFSQTDTSSSQVDTSSSQVALASSDLLFGHMDNFAGVHACMRAHFSGLLGAEHTLIEVTYGEEEDDKDGVDFKGAREVLEKKLNARDVVVVLDVTGVHTTSNIVFEKVGTHPLLLSLLQSALGKPARINGKNMHSAEKEEVSGLGPNLSALSLSENSSAVENHFSVRGAVEAEAEAKATSSSRDAGFESWAKTRAVLGSETDFKSQFSYEIYTGCEDPVANQDESDVYRLGTPFCFFMGIPVRGGQVGKFRSKGDYNDGPVFVRQMDLDATVCALICLSTTFETMRSSFLGSQLTAADWIHSFMSPPDSDSGTDSDSEAEGDEGDIDFVPQTVRPRK